jgi:hypothetical protein
MTITSVALTYPTGVLLSWEDTNGVQAGYTIDIVEVDLRDPSSSIVRSETFTAPLVKQWFDDELSSTSDQVTYTITGVTDSLTSSEIVQLTGAYAFGVPDDTASTIRYTTLADVKSALGISSADTGRDTRITQAIVAAETFIDATLGRSFPDSGAVEQLASVPERVKLAATNMSVAFYVAQSSPDGVLESEVRRQESYQVALALLTGLQVSWGVA